ncbi:MAG: hypothetical protein ATN34_02520 [Epulopiscium sp. Nele67-Bin002]|nr:MAG: hypothetical protein BEN18_06340 [Epulopiscium sp. Nuni2H_MBin001]OON90211.1 MAG: hypothetical protein ATN33_03605 [Epulopiscium sp. Nele67-Bin001]OON91944.1 MAG: hypothetical protein ATN34_02520 [Epulopiscium sp. Nele67-Bin002]
MPPKKRKPRQTHYEIPEDIKSEPPKAPIKEPIKEPDLSEQDMLLKHIIIGEVLSQPMCKRRRRRLP